MSESSPPRAEILRVRDLVGWPVVDAQGAKVGTIDDLLLDRSGSLRFVSVDLGLFRKSVLLPARRLEWGEASMVLSGYTAAEVSALAAYRPEVPLTPTVLEEMERAHPRLYGAPGSAAPLLSPSEGVAETAVPLSQAKDFKLARDAPDPRGWNVFGADGERAGTVAGLLVDPAAMKVRYLEVDLADDLFGLDEDRHVLVPIERVELRERGRDAWIGGLTAAELATLPAYTGGAVDPLTRRLTDEGFAGADRSAPALSAGTPGVRVREETTFHRPASGGPPPLPERGPGDFPR